jgi:hypothetical protein
MTSNRHDPKRCMTETRRVVVVLGQPDDTHVASLRTARLAPVMQDGEDIIWDHLPGRPAVAANHGEMESAGSNGDDC